MWGPYVSGIPGFGPIESLLYLGTVIICSREAEIISIMMKVCVQLCIVDVLMYPSDDSVSDLMSLGVETRKVVTLIGYDAVFES